jgi:predicted choloylglycine hydrolase
MELAVFEGTHHQVGEQIGARYRDDITHFVERHGAWNRPGGSRERIVQECDRVFDLLGGLAPELCEELDGISQGSGLPLETVLCYNFHNALAYLPAQQCTNLALRDSDRGPLLIKNHDATVAEKSVYSLQHRKYRHRLRILCVSYGGTVWAQGMSSAGLATGGSSVHPADSDEYRLGLPDGIVGRLMLEKAATTEEAIRLFEGVPYTGKGCNYAVADAQGEAAILEGSKDKKVVLRMEGDYIYCTNLYASGQIEHRTEPEYLENARGRAALLDRYLSEDGPLTVQRAREIMSSHDGPISLCRHGATDSTGNDTLMAHLALMAEGRMLFAERWPCEARWAEWGV